MAAGQAAGFNAGLEFSKSWYALTARESRRFPVLTGAISADLAIVGGGATGLSAALHAAASRDEGRAGRRRPHRLGRVGPAWWPDDPGPAQGRRRHWSPALAPNAHGRCSNCHCAARSLVIDLIERHAMGCDLRLTGHLTGAARDSDIDGFEAEVRALEDVMHVSRGARCCRGRCHTGDGRQRVSRRACSMPAAGISTRWIMPTASPGRQQARALCCSKNSPALALDRTGSGVIIRTAQGSIRCKTGGAGR